MLDASGVDLEWTGSDRRASAALESVGDPLPESTVEAVRAADATLKGPATTPSGKGFRSINVALRQKVDALRELPTGAIASWHRRRGSTTSISSSFARTLKAFTAAWSTPSCRRRRREFANHHGARRRSESRCFAFQTAQRQGPQACHLRAQGEHSETERRTVSRFLSQDRCRSFPTSNSTIASSTRRR